MAANRDSTKHLALAIVDWLNRSVADGTISSDDAESIEIATNCISEAFKVDGTDKAAIKEALGGRTLMDIYNVYEQIKGRSTASTTGSSSAAEGKPSTPVTGSAASVPKSSGATEDQKAQADKLKAQGNAAMQQRDYPTAIKFYTDALDLNPLNPIYLSNRAAAYSGSGDHESAKEDAEMAVAADPSFAKAWSRLGLAKFALGDAKGSMEAYKKGIDAEGSGGSDAMRKGYETAKRRVEEEGSGEVDDVAGSRGFGGGAGAGGMPDLSSLAGMFGGGGGGAGGGGMPNFAEMMNNPMMQQMAQSLMSNPDMMNNLLSNPRLRDLASQFGGGGAPGAGRGEGGGGGGGGGPDFASLMNDPSIQEMARNFMGGGAGRGGAGRGA